MFCSSTIEDLLYQCEPSIDYCKTGSGGHTKVKNPKSPLIIRRWSDFNLETLKSMGNGIFRDALQSEHGMQDYHVPAIDLRKSFEAPPSERVLEDYLSQSVQPTVVCALSKTQELFREQGILAQIKGSGITMGRGAFAADIIGEKGTTANKSANVDGAAQEGNNRSTCYLADWAGIFKLTDKEIAKYDHSKTRPPKPDTYIPGDTKLRGKVDFSLLHQANKRITHLFFDLFGLDDDGMDQPRKRIGRSKEYKTEYEGLRAAITQIYTYLYYSACRYGYIITETQLMVVRVRPTSGKFRDDCISGSNDEYPEDLDHALAHEGLLEYQLIPYNNKDRNKLSVSVSLWWIHILAAIDHTVQWWYPDLKDMPLNTILSKLSNLRREESEYVPPLHTRMIEPPMLDDRPPAQRSKKRKQLGGRGGNDMVPSNLQDMVEETQNVREPDLSFKKSHTSAQSVVAMKGHPVRQKIASAKLPQAKQEGQKRQVRGRRD